MTGKNEILIENLPQSVSEKRIGEIFCKGFGKIKSISIITDKQNNSSSATVSFIAVEDAHKAEKQVNGLTWESRTLSVHLIPPSEIKMDEVGSSKEESRQCASAAKCSSSSDCRSKQSSSSSLPTAKPTDHPTPNSIHSNSKTKRNHGKENKKNPGSFPDSKPLQELELVLSHIEDLFTWHCQKHSALADLVDLDQKMNDLCPNLPRIKGAPSLLHQVYGAQFSEDLSWYRCKILAHRTYEKSFGLYIDYGNVELIDHSRIVVLPDYYMLIPAFSFKCKIQHPSSHHDIRPKDPNAYKYLSQFVNKAIQVRAFESKGLNRHNPNLCITEARHNGVDIIASLRTKTKSSRSPNEKKPSNRPTHHSHSPTLSSASDSNWSPSTVLQEAQGSLPAGSGEPMHTQNGPVAEAAGSNTSFLHNLEELTKKGQQLMVKRIQLPSSPALDLLENALELVPEGQYLPLLDSARTCHSLLDSFCLLQDNIRALTDKAQLDGLLGERAQAIPLLQQQFNHLSSSIKNFPIQSNLSVLEDRMEKIKKCYKEFLDIPAPDHLTTEKAVEAYQNLKRNRKDKLEVLQKKSTSDSEKFASCLNTLTKYFPLSSNLDPPTEAFDITSLTKVFEQVSTSIDLEMAAYWPVSQQEGERESVAALAQLMLKELQRRHQALSQLQRDYNGLFLPRLADITRDFSISPSLGPLNDCRTSLRSLKSRLRHRLADRQDLLEAEDQVDQDHLDLVNAEIGHILKELHLVLLEEDTQLKYLAELEERYFPELSVEYPDLNLKQYTKYGGLVKPHWEHKYFSEGEHLCHNLMQTQFAGNPTLMQEHNLPSPAARDHFLERVQEWDSKFEDCTPKGILAPTAVFLSKKKAQGYVLYPCRGVQLSLLGSVPSAHLPQPLEMIHILVDIVGALHAQGFAHGALSPLTTILGPPLHILPLHPSLDHQPFLADDVFALGLTILWLCQPSPVPFSPEVEPAVWLSGVDPGRMTDTQLSTVRSMLLSQPEQRPSMAQVTQVFQPSSALVSATAAAVEEEEEYSRGNQARLSELPEEEDEEEEEEEDSSPHPTTTTDSIMDLLNEFQESLAAPMDDSPPFSNLDFGECDPPPPAASSSSQ